MVFKFKLRKTMVVVGCVSVNGVQVPSSIERYEHSRWFFRKEHAFNIFDTYYDDEKKPHSCVYTMEHFVYVPCWWKTLYNTRKHMNTYHAWWKLKWSTSGLNDQFMWYAHCSYIIYLMFTSKCSENENWTIFASNQNKAVCRTDCSTWWRIIIIIISKNITNTYTHSCSNTWYSSSSIDTITAEKGNEHNNKQH